MGVDGKEVEKTGKLQKFASNRFYNNNNFYINMHKANRKKLKEKRQHL